MLASPYYYDGGRMVIKSYKDVSPTSYQGVPEGVQIREMITADDGAPTFARIVTQCDSEADPT